MLGSWTKQDYGAHKLPRPHNGKTLSSSGEGLPSVAAPKVGMQSPKSEQAQGLYQFQQR